MPERWLAEVQKVERLRPIPDLLARAEAGPTMPEPAPRPRSRFAAGLLAVFVAIAGGWAAYNALAAGGETATNVGTSSVGWPDASIADAEQVQARVDSGDPDAQWRTEAAAVALRYGHSVLGWPDPLAALEATSDPDTVIVSLHGPDASCTGAGCDTPSPQTIVTLTLQRLTRFGAGGIWSVTKADR
jgi:hypothetical protein